MATDIDPNCLRIARKNAKVHGAEIKFYQGDLLSPLLPVPSPLFAILANLPYVPNDFTINQAATMEPKIAIFGGPDGLDVYRRLFGQLGKLKSRPQYVLTESLPPQHAKLAKIAQKAAYGLTIADDFIQVFKLKE
jgi:release factor glutamine methyltransferase